MKNSSNKTNTKFNGHFFYVTLIAIALLMGCKDAKNENKTMKNLSNDPANQPTDAMAGYDSTKTFQELGIIKIKDGKMNQWISAVQTNIVHSREEEGNISFHLYQSKEKEQTTLWFERFKTKMAHNAHLKQDYFKAAVKDVDEIRDGEVISIYLKEISEVPAAAEKETANPSTTQNVIILFDVKPDKRDVFVNAFKEAAPNARQAPGNIQFNLFRYADEPNKFVSIETWENIDNYKTHKKSKYLAKLEAALDGVFVSNPMENRWVVKDISQ